MVAAAADGTRQVHARVSGVCSQFRRRVPGDTSPEPETVVVGARRHTLASVLADVW